jgi:hypothetical protein
LVIIATTSAPRTQASADAAATTSMPNSPCIWRAKASRLSGVRLNTRTVLIGRTAQTAAIWVRACLPVPMVPRIFASGRASARVAMPLAAPVRNRPSRSDSITAASRASAIE